MMTRGPSPISPSSRFKPPPASSKPLSSKGKAASTPGGSGVFPLETQADETAVAAQKSAASIAPNGTERFIGEAFGLVSGPLVLVERDRDDLVDRDVAAVVAAHVLHDDRAGDGELIPGPGRARKHQGGRVDRDRAIAARDRVDR